MGHDMVEWKRKNLYRQSKGHQKHCLFYVFFGGFGNLYRRSKGHQKHCPFYFFFWGIWGFIHAVKRLSKTLLFLCFVWGGLGNYTGSQKVIKNIAFSMFFLGGFGNLYRRPKGHQRHCLFYVFFLVTQGYFFFFLYSCNDLKNDAILLPKMTRSKPNNAKKTK